MIRIFLFAAFVLMLTSCSSTVDTSKMSMQEYLDYAMSLYNDEDYQYALNEFRAITLQYPGSAVNDDAQYYLAMTHFQRGEYLLAVYEFSKLIRDIPASPFFPDAQYMLAESYYSLSPHPSLDQSYTKKAIEEFQVFIDFFPTNDKVDEAEGKIKSLNDKLAEKDYQSAVIYERMEYYKAAIKYYALVAETYHDSNYAPLALYNRVKILISRNEINEALTDIDLFLNRYADHKYASEMRELSESLNN